MRDDESLSSYPTRLNELINQMRTFGESLSNERLVQKVLISLSKPYDSICLIIENTKCLETVELQEVVAILKSQEQRFDLHNVDTIEKAFASFSFGHWARECTAGKIVQKANSLNQVEVTGNLFYADSAISETNVNGNWYIDSGCNNHMTGNDDLLVDIRTNVAGKVQMHTGALVIVAGMGSLEIDTNKGNKYIRKVMYLPRLKENLLSVGQTDEHGYYLLFGECICSIFDGPSLDNLVIKVKKKENICYPLSLWKNNQLVFRKLALIQVLPGFGTRD
ncbi:hypothetical protein EV1_003966 [Malus domestica]